MEKKFCKNGLRRVEATPYTLYIKKWSVKCKELKLIVSSKQKSKISKCQKEKKEKKLTVFKGSKN